jgi:HSP20 family protein
MATRPPDQRLTNGFDRLPDAVERLLQDTVALPFPPTNASERPAKIACNLIETWANYYVQVALPGIDPERVDLQVVGREVIVRGTYAPPEVDNGTYLWRGMSEGEFSEVFQLPADVAGDKAEAHYERGILTVRLPKVDYLKPKAIKVQMAK